MRRVKPLPDDVVYELLRFQSQQRRLALGNDRNVNSGFAKISELLLGPRQPGGGLAGRHHAQRVWFEGQHNNRATGVGGEEPRLREELLVRAVELGKYYRQVVMLDHVRKS